LRSGALARRVCNATLIQVCCSGIAHERSLWCWLPSRATISSRRLGRHLPSPPNLVTQDEREERKDDAGCNNAGRREDLCRPVRTCAQEDCRRRGIRESAHQEGLGADSRLRDSSRCQRFVADQGAYSDCRYSGYERATACQVGPRRSDEPQEVPECEPPNHTQGGRDRRWQANHRT
jgi:hypothetical protein